jgi:hypothetical protein
MHFNIFKSRRPDSYQKDDKDLELVADFIDDKSMARRSPVRCSLMKLVPRGPVLNNASQLLRFIPVVA